MSTLVEAARARVWEALSDPSQWCRWRPGRLEPMPSEPPPPSAFEPGRGARWRCRIHRVPVVLEAVPREMVPRVRLVTELSLGLFRFQETFTLAPGSDGPGLTRVSLKIATPNEMPVVGGVIDRFGVRRYATELAAHGLQAVRDWCEASAAADGVTLHARSGAAR